MPEYWHRSVLDDALGAFDTGAAPLAHGRSALGTQLVVEALYRAARTGRWTDLTDVTSDSSRVPGGVAGRVLHPSRGGKPLQ
jgi:hypothetical protein